jgi:6-phosphogluconate dehydrogenase
MQIGMIGLGRMGANMVRRLMRAGHECVVYDRSADTVSELEGEGATGSTELADFVAKLQTPRAICMMIPAGYVDQTLEALVEHLDADDVVVDGGNSDYRDDLRRSKDLAERDIHYVDMGTSGGVFGLDRGYCLMIGGDDTAVQRLDPFFAGLAPGRDAAQPTPGRDADEGTAAEGYLHCGSSGAGHYVKMVHNGIEYGLMAAYSEGLNILHHASVGAEEHEVDAETTPMREPELYRYTFDLAEIAEVWRRGSVISSWLLDLTAQALHTSPTLDDFSGHVSDSGEGRWTALAAIDTGAPAPVLTTALFSRFASRGEGDFANRALSAMRLGFGGHLEK